MTKRVVAALAVALACIGAVTAPPASAGTGQSVQTYLTSQLGDYIGQGRPIAYSTPAYEVFVNSATPGYLSIALNGPGSFLVAQFGSDQGQPLAAGQYLDARRFNTPGPPPARHRGRRPGLQRHQRLVPHPGDHLQRPRHPVAGGRLRAAL